MLCRWSSKLYYVWKISYDTAEATLTIHVMVQGSLTHSVCFYLVLTVWSGIMVHVPGSPMWYPPIFYLFRPLTALKGQYTAPKSFNKLLLFGFLKVFYYCYVDLIIVCFLFVDKPTGRKCIKKYKWLLSTVF